MGGMSLGGWWYDVLRWAEDCAHLTPSSQRHIYLDILCINFVPILYRFFVFFLCFGKTFYIFLYQQINNYVKNTNQINF